MKTGEKTPATYSKRRGLIKMITINTIAILLKIAVGAAIILAALFTAVDYKQGKTNTVECFFGNLGLMTMFTVLLVSVIIILL